MARTYEERAVELEEKIAQMTALRKELLEKQKQEERRNRTHRLIQIGAVLEKAAGDEIDPEILAMYLQTKIREDKDGNPVTVIDLQRRYYKNAVERIAEEKNAEEPNVSDEEFYDSEPEEGKTDSSWGQSNGETSFS